MINKQYQKLCIKEITGNITQNEKYLLDNWLADSDDNKKEFEKIKDIWAVNYYSELPASIDIDMEWTKLNEKIRTFDKQGVKETFWGKSFSLGFVPKLRPILVGVFVLFAVVIGIYLLNQDVSKPILNVINTSNKEYKEIQLPDGSTVHLNSCTRIKYLTKSDGDRKIFNNGDRKVILNGEAFFSVTKNKKPFIITTENAKITVLGTKFDVLSRDKNTRVVVKEGKVNFSTKDMNAKAIYLTKDQLSTINKNSEPTLPRQVDAGYFLGWMNGSIIFYRTSISEIARDLERRYNIKISLPVDSLNNYTLTGSFKNSDADSAVSMVCLALGLDFEKQNDNYIIKIKNILQ